MTIEQLESSLPCEGRNADSNSAGRAKIWVFSSKVRIPSLQVGEDGALPSRPTKHQSIMTTLSDYIKQYDSGRDTYSVAIALHDETFEKYRDMFSRGFGVGVNPGWYSIDQREVW